jgi:hypothetical protein
MQEQIRTQTRTIGEQLVALARGGRYEELRSPAGRRVAARLARRDLVTMALHGRRSPSLAARQARSTPRGWPPAGVEVRGLPDGRVAWRRADGRAG